MKLARVDHRRCDDYAGTTLVWVDDDMTDEQLQEAVDKAVDAYFQALKDFSEANEAPPFATINWEQNRARVVADVLEEHQANQALRAEYDKRKRLATNSFDYFLYQQEGVHEFWSQVADMNVEAYWGHMHGTEIMYGETEWPKFKLLKTKRATKPGGRVRRVYEEPEWL